jgi:hypothetical protein
VPTWDSVDVLLLTDPETRHKSDVTVQLYPYKGTFVFRFLKDTTNKRAMHFQGRSE